MLIPAQRVPPPHRQAGGGARPGQGSRDRGPCPAPSTLTLTAFGGRRGGVSPPEPLAFEVLPVSLRAGKLRVRKDGGGGGSDALGLGVAVLEPGRGSPHLSAT